MKRIVLLLLTLSLTIFAGGQDIKEHTERKKRIEEEISNIDKQLNANIDKKRESIRTLALTREKIESRKRLISQIDTGDTRLRQGHSAKREGDLEAQSQTGHPEGVPLQSRSQLL